MNTEQVAYFNKLIQGKLEQLPRAIEGGEPISVLREICQEIQILKDAKEHFSQNRIHPTTTRITTMETQTIEFNGATLNVTYNVSKYYPATLEYPAEGGEVDIQEIYLEDSDINIVDLLEPQLDDISDNLDINLYDYV